MTKTLLIYARPTGWTLQSTFTVKVFNQLKELKDITAIKLDDHGKFDISYQVDLLNQSENVIFLFPIHFFNIPWNLSKYFADVLENNGTLRHKNVYLINSCYMSQETFNKKIYGCDMNEFLNNIKGLIKFFDGNLVKQWTFYGASDKNLEKLQDFMDDIKDTLCK